MVANRTPCSRREKWNCILPCQEPISNRLLNLLKTRDPVNDTQFLQWPNKGVSPTPLGPRSKPRFQIRLFSYHLSNENHTRELKQPRWQRQLKCLFIIEFVLSQTSLILSHFIQFVKCWGIFMELTLNQLYLSSYKKRQLSCAHVGLHKTWNYEVSPCGRATTTKECSKKSGASAKLLFCLIHPLLFGRSRCSCRCLCLSFLLSSVAHTRLGL